MIPKTVRQETIIADVWCSVVGHKLSLTVASTTSTNEQKNTL